MNYTEVSYDSVAKITVIQVTGCSKTTSIDVSNVQYQSDQYVNLLEQTALSVLEAMDPASPTYDATLVGS